MLPNGKSLNIAVPNGLSLESLLDLDGLLPYSCAVVQIPDSFGKHLN